VRLALHVGQAQREARLAERARDALTGPVGEHHDQDAVEALVLVLAHHALDVVAIAGGRLDHALRDALERPRDLSQIATLALGDARQHLVVELLHDPHHTDARSAVGHGCSPLPQCCP
jgi:thiamine pyrophosphokinase